jgi:hypothetical protein
MSDDWELIHPNHPFINSLMNDMVEDILKELSLGEPQDENEY